MHAVDILASGNPIAANGTAILKRAGTATRVNWYTEAEGGDSVRAASEDVLLDGAGTASVYVDEPVDVYLLDATGAEVGRHTVQSRTTAIEVSSVSFTGVDPETGKAETNQPIDLATVLRRWYESAGAPDWQVNLAGVTKTLVNAFGPIIAGVYNSADPTFSDGTDDYAVNINNAIAAAAAAGGGIVIIPAGTHNCATDVTVPNSVSLLGPGDGVARLAFTAENQLVLDGTAGVKSATIQGIEFYTAATRATHDLVVCTTMLGHDFIACGFSVGDGGEAVGIIDFDPVTASSCTFTGCRFEGQDITNAVDLAGAVNPCAFVGCTFIMSGACDYIVDANGSSTAPPSIAACSFDMAGVDGACYAVRKGSCVGCSFVGDGMDHVALHLGSEFASTFEDCTPYSSYTYITGLDDFSGGTYYTRIARGSAVHSMYEVSYATASIVTAAPISASTCVFRASGQAATTMEIELPSPDFGADLTIAVFNDNSGNLTVTLVPDELTLFAGTATYVIAEKKMRLFRLKGLRGSDLGDTPDPAAWWILHDVTSDLERQVMN